MLRVQELMIKQKLIKVFSTNRVKHQDIKEKSPKITRKQHCQPIMGM